MDLEDVGKGGEFEGQCSRLKSSMPFNRNLALQNIPLLNTTLHNATPN